MVTSDQAGGPAGAVWRETNEAGIHVHWTPVPYDNVMGYFERMKAFLKFAWRAARKAAALRADVVFATSTPLTIALPAVYASRRSRAPMEVWNRQLTGSAVSRKCGHAWQMGSASAVDRTTPTFPAFACAQTRFMFATKSAE